MAPPCVDDGPARMIIASLSMRHVPPWGMCLRSMATYLPPSFNNVTGMVRGMKANSKLDSSPCTGAARSVRLSRLRTEVRIGYLPRLMRDPAVTRSLLILFPVAWAALCLQSNQAHAARNSFFPLAIVCELTRLAGSADRPGE